MFLLIKIFSHIRQFLYFLLSTFCTRILFYSNNIKNLRQLKSYGIPIIKKSRHGKFKVGINLLIHNNANYAILGYAKRTKFYVGKNASLILGDNIGLSNTSIIANKSIKIGNNCLIGGGSFIVDSDFHALESHLRNTTEEHKYVKKEEVIIEDNVFIGMNSIILKGVKIGKGSVIAAGSVVSRDIPEGEIWGGNPVVFIKKI